VVQPRVTRSRRDLDVKPDPLRGCLYWVAIPGEPGRKRRPALVVSVNARNRLASDVLVVPASTSLRIAPTHVRLRKGTGGLPTDSVLKCEQITTLPKGLLSDAALGGPLSARLLVEVERGVLRAIGVSID
jgi:mRNA-degrading endonuclease toxin of MazEF toxin-antitoxin module